MVFGRDSIAERDLEKLINSKTGIYRSCHDAGYELSAKALKQFLGDETSRCSTGYRYWTGNIEKKQQLYNREAAIQSAETAAPLPEKVYNQLKTRAVSMGLIV